MSHIDPLAVCCTSCFSTSSAVLRLCGFLVLLRSVVQKHSPLPMFGLELPVFPSLCSLSRKRRGAPSALSGSERIDALRYQRIKKAKKMMMNNNNSKTRKKAGVNSVPVCSRFLYSDIFLLKDVFLCVLVLTKDVFYLSVMVLKYIFFSHCMSPENCQVNLPLNFLSICHIPFKVQLYKCVSYLL